MARDLFEEAGINSNNEPHDLLSQENNESQEEGFLNKLPRNILAGLAQQGHSIINLPHDLGERGKTVGEQFKEGLVKLKGPEIGTKEYEIPHQQEYDYASMLGQKTPTLSDIAIQKLVEHLPDIATARAAFRALPLTAKSSARPLQQASRLIEGREIGKNIPLNQEMLTQAQQFLPRTPETRRLLEDASAGDYKAIFSLQSDIGREARNLRKSPLAAERRLAPEAQSLKRSILEGLTNHFENLDVEQLYGHEDIAQLIKKGIRKYAKHKQLSENVYPVLKKYGIPTSIFAAGVEAPNIIKKLSD